MTARIALVTSQSLPVLDADDLLLLEHLPEAEIVAWEDPSAVWERYDVVVIRSTWNYTDRLSEFLAWVTRVSQLSELHNPPEIIHWNTDKHYLTALAERGIPTVPTEYVAPGANPSRVRLAGHVVVKPTVGAGSNGAKLLRNDPAGALAHITFLHEQGLDAMVQPYLNAVDHVGETALVYLGGEFSHAVRKAAILSTETSWSTGLYADEKLSATSATAQERALADRIVAELPDLAYTRVDLLPGDDGPVLLELELTEPSLFLAHDDGAPARAASVFRGLLN